MSWKGNKRVWVQGSFGGCIVLCLQCAEMLEMHGEQDLESREGGVAALTACVSQKRLVTCWMLGSTALLYEC